MFLIGISSVKLATDSYLTDYAAALVAFGLRKNKTITCLNLNNNMIGDKGAKAIAGII